MAEKGEKIINSPDYLAFVEWDGTPDHLRDIHSDTEYAEKIGKTRMTLYNWRKIEGHADRVMKHYQTFHAIKLKNVRDTLYNKAKAEGDTKAIDIFLRYEDKWIPTEKQEVSGKVSISAEEIAGMVKDILKDKK